MTVQNSFMFRVWENLRLTLKDVKTELKSEGIEISAVGFGEIVKNRPAIYIMLNDTKGESGQGFRFEFATNKGGTRGSMTRDAKGILVFDIIVYGNDDRLVNRRDDKVGARNTFRIGWRIFEAFERKIGKDPTLNFESRSLTNEDLKVVTEDVRYLNYEIDEIYQDIDLSGVEGSDRFFNINVRVSVNARLDSII